MSFLPFALSLSSTFTKIGAIAAFAALVGIAALSLLVFSQARELKRLREWAGRAPERAADLEQRVTAAAAVRAQQQAPAVQAVRQAPRASPIPAAAAAAAGPASRVLATPIPPGTGVVPAGQALNASGAPAAPVAPVPGATRPPAPFGQPPAPTVPPGAVPPAPVGAPASAAAAAQSRPAPVGAAPAGVADPRPPAPATAAAAAGVATPRAPSPPPSPATPGGPQPPSTPQTQVPPVPQAPAPSSPPVARRPPAPAAPAVAARADPRAPAPAAGQMGRAAGVSPLQGGRSVYSARRSRGRTAALIAGGLVVVAALAALAVTLLGGSSSGGKATTTSATTATGQAVTHASHKSHKAVAKAPAVNPAETNVAVLNATESEGLAHRTAIQLKQGGYSQATALNGKPPGSGQVSVVEYTGGHRPEAEAVARSVSVTHVLPIEAGVTALAGSASVVVIVGADKAA